MKHHEKQPETTKIPWKIMKINPKSTQYNDIKKHCQQWVSPNEGISSDGNVCPKNIGIKSLRKKDHHDSIARKI